MRIAPALRPALLPLAIAAALQAAGGVHAQTPAPANAPAAEAKPEEKPTVLDRILVTVRKRAEASQEVPVAVSAFNADTLERAKITGAADLQFSVPNAVLTGNDRFTIRGIGNNSLGGDNGVGLAVNGAAIVFVPQDELFDMERIEVLRGPQGTLFGRNTTGGALAVFTKKPTPKAGGNFSIEGGNFGHKRVSGMVNIPFSENIRQRFAGYSLKRDGFTENQGVGSAIDGRDQWGARSSTTVFAGDTEINLVIAGYNEDSSRTRESKRRCKAIPVLGCSPNELGFDSPNFSATLFNSLAGPLTGLGFITPGSANIYAGAINPSNFRAVATDYDARFKLKNEAATLEVSHEFDNVTLTYVGGYSRFSTDQRTDWDNALLTFRFARPVTYNVARDLTVTTDQLLTTDSFTANSRTSSQEIRLASRSKGPFSYTTGVFFLESKGDGGFFIFHPFFEIIQKVQGRPAETWFVNTESRGSTRAQAWFGEGQFKFGDRLRATLGARYTREQRNGEGRSIVLSASVPFTARPELSDSHWTARTAIDYAPSTDLLYYASIATGYKGGGFNTGSGSNPTFAPEKVTAFEVGFKSEWAANTVRVNGALFHNDYKDMQLAQRISAAAITANTDVKTKGAELELAIAPSKAWLFDSNISFLDTRIGAFSTIDSANPAQSLTATTPAVPISLAGNKLPHSPKSKFKIGAQHTMAIPGTGWSATARLDHVRQAEYFAREFNTPTDRIPAWSVSNFQLRFANGKGDVEIKAFVKNISDAANITNIIIEDPLVGRYRNVRLLDPRTFGVQLQFNF